jgi:hypothetical protein
MRQPRHKTPSSAKRARSASGADVGDRQDHPSDRGRWSSRRKTEVVLRLFRGEPLDAFSRELGVTPGKLAEWRDEAVEAIRVRLQSREPDHRDGFIHDLKAKVGEQAMPIELLGRKIEILEDDLRPPPRRPSQACMIGSLAMSPSLKKA